MRLARERKLVSTPHAIPGRPRGRRREARPTRRNVSRKFRARRNRIENWVVGTCLAVFGVIFFVIYSGNQEAKDPGRDVEPVSGISSTDTTATEMRDDGIAKKVELVNLPITDLDWNDDPDENSALEENSSPIIVSEESRPQTEDEVVDEDAVVSGLDSPPAGPNNKFRLTLSGLLGGEELDPGDPQTWAQIGYFLQNASTPYYLVFPGGSSPLIRMKDSKGKLVPLPPRSKNRRGPFGDSANPTYRLHITAEAKESGTITFYGEAIGKKYVCNLNCRFETVEGDNIKMMEFTIQQKITPTLQKGDTSSRFLRQTYDQATEKLIRRLKSEPLFQR